jgi:predicted ABC-type ATPase
MSSIHQIVVRIKHGEIRHATVQTLFRCLRDIVVTQKNADLIAAGMSPFEPELTSIAAGRVMLVQIKHLVKAPENFVIETTLSGLGLPDAVASLA